MTWPLSRKFAATGVKRLVRRSAYVAQSLREMARYEVPTVAVRLDELEARAASVVVTNGRPYAC